VKAESFFCLFSSNISRRGRCVSVYNFMINKLKLNKKKMAVNFNEVIRNVRKARHCWEEIVIRLTELKLEFANS